MIVYCGVDLVVSDEIEKKKKIVAISFRCLTLYSVYIFFLVRLPMKPTYKPKPDLNKLLPNSLDPVSSESLIVCPAWDA